MGASMVEFILILGAMVIYFTPALVAAWVRHPRLAYISGVNAALGVTVVGWAGALMWALRRRRVVARSYHGDMEMPRSFNTSLLAIAGLVIGVAVVATVAANRLQIHHTTKATAGLYAATVSVPQAQWQYATAGGLPVASLESRNSLTPPAPFKGGPLTLSLSRGASGMVVRLDADAELACSYAPTASTVEISFDSGPGQAFACAPAPAGARALLFDGDHSTAYLADPTAFLARMTKARHLSVTTAIAGATDPQSLAFDLPAGAPALQAAAPAPALAPAAVSPLPATADEASLSVQDQAGEGDHGRHPKHHAAAHQSGHGRGHSGHRVRSHHTRP